MPAITCEQYDCRFNNDGTCTAVAIVLKSEGWDGTRCAAYRFSLSKESQVEKYGKDTEAHS